jgi:hypothetical protein
VLLVLARRAVTWDWGDGPQEQARRAKWEAAEKAKADRKARRKEARRKAAEARKKARRERGRHRLAALGRYIAQVAGDIHDGMIAGFDHLFYG